MLRRPDSRYERVKQTTQRCLELRAVLVNHVLENGCCDNKDGCGEDDTPVDLCELAGVPVRIEPQDEEDADINLDIVFYVREVGRLGLYESHEDNGIRHVDQEDGPEIGRGVKVPEVHH